jgi:alkanesulfonate monooxygenase SsuD/methylene tetrahydromethanopterin reductase-like flavin-dependent oxidoreductase (luciferase family)
VVQSGAHQALSFEYLRDSRAVLVGDPDQVLETARDYQAAGVDLLLCLVNPYKIPHEKVCQTIELIGKHVIPEFSE